MGDVSLWSWGRVDASTDTIDGAEPGHCVSLVSGLEGLGGVDGCWLAVNAKEIGEICCVQTATV